MSSVFRLLWSRNTPSLLRRNCLQIAPVASIQPQLQSVARSVQLTKVPTRFFAHCVVLRSAEKHSDDTSSSAVDAATAEADEHNPLDRTRIVTLEESQRYLASEAYAQTYGERPVWEQYRRNHKGPFAPRRTRKTCVRKGMISTGNPCPICRDEYLLLDHRNLELLNQFISPHTGETLSYSKTGLCQKKHQQLLLAIERARDQGLITYDVPFRQYDYAEYYPAELLQQKAGN